MTAQSITFLVSSFITAYALGWAWGASVTYFKQFLEKVQ